MILKQINFRQPKYIFPAVMAVPLGALIYFVSQIFGGSNTEQVATDHINMNLPEAKIESEYDKLRSMERRYENGENYSAVGSVGLDEAGKEKLENEEYSEEELRKLIAEAERKAKEEKEMLEMQRNLESSSKRMQGASDNRSYAQVQEDMEVELEVARQRTKKRIADLYNEPDPEEAARAEANRLAMEQQKQQEANKPSEVIKADNLVHSKFNTVENQSTAPDAPLIKAMIDKTTKSTEGTRLRFKLLDDVIIEDVKLLKGSYLYGTVTGFGTQRVKANITSVLAGSRFLNVNLSVYDVDGMEGFYVPESSFREFVQNAAAGVAGQNIQFSNNSTGSGFNAENFALQALQNIYQAGSSALSRNVKKNKAKIKYNTIVYLINTSNI